jgi:hypothetical protein
LCADKALRGLRQLYLSHTAAARPLDPDDVVIEPLTLIVLALAGWRIAYMLTNEDGPANVFGWLRRKIEDPVWNGEARPGSLEKLFACVYCMSFWTTVAAALIWAVDIKAGRDALFIVAVWGAATALDMVARREP